MHPFLVGRDPLQRQRRVLLLLLLLLIRADKWLIVVLGGFRRQVFDPPEGRPGAVLALLELFAFGGDGAVRVGGRGEGAFGGEGRVLVLVVPIGRDADLLVARLQTGKCGLVILLAGAGKSSKTYPTQLLEGQPVNKGRDRQTSEALKDILSGDE